MLTASITSEGDQPCGVLERHMPMMLMSKDSECSRTDLSQRAISISWSDGRSCMTEWKPPPGDILRSMASCSVTVIKFDKTFLDRYIKRNLVGWSFRFPSGFVRDTRRKRSRLPASLDESAKKSASSGEWLNTVVLGFHLFMSISIVRRAL